MASEAILDFEKLLAPISEETPCGESLRWDPLWDEIRAARESKADAVDSSADTEANWPQVAELTQEALAGRSKDLMIAGWLTESLTRLHGVCGLRDGLRLIHEMVEKYWDRLYPEIDEDDPEVRAAPFYWLTDADAGARMPWILRAEVPFAPSLDGEVFSFSEARLTSPPQGENEDSDNYARRVAETERRKQAFESAVGTQPRERYVDMYEDLNACREEIRTLSDLLDEKLDEAAPGWTGIRNALDDLEGLIKRIVNDKGGMEGISGAEEGNGAAGGEETAAGGTGGGAGPLRTRADAVNRLREVSEFFRRTEPHSPVAHLVQRAVNWAGMTFEQVMQDLVRDSGVMERIEETLGLQKPPGDDES